MKKTILTTALLALAVLPASGQSPATSSMPGMGAAMPGMIPPNSAMMTMSSSVDLNSSMGQEASGTAWLPASSPVYAAMQMRPNGDMLMLHGAAMPRYTDVGSKRGDRRFDAPNWLMGMYAHPLGDTSQLGLRAMISADPITEGGYGYPLLYQTGESWHGDPLHDRQHPHDLFSELSASYSHLLGGGNSAFLYLGYPGEPALGPPTYMHRLIAYDYADAPLGHHWQDATHITFGVATAGLNLGNRFKLESSVFTGREPDENRYSFDKPRWDSQSGRLSFNPNADNAFQVSYGFIKNAEGDGVNQHRTTASWLYNKPLGDDANLTTTLVWGQNDLATEGRTNSYLAEADYQRGRDTVFSRFENITKSGHELVLSGDLAGGKYNLNALTVGYVRDLTHGRGVDTGVGAAVTLDTHPASLNSVYGSNTPLGFEVFFRFRPSRLKMGGMGSSAKMHMPQSSSSAMNMPAKNMATASHLSPPLLAPTPAVTPSSPGAASTVPATSVPELHTSPKIVSPRITASTVPASPQARRKTLLTIVVLGRDGKPVTGAVVSARWSMESMDMGTTKSALHELGGGRYAGSVQFAMAGPWRVDIMVQPGGSRTPMVKTLHYSVR